MTVAELLRVAKVEGVTLQSRGTRLIWSADHQPPSELLAELTRHKLEIIETLTVASDLHRLCGSWDVVVPGYAPFSMTNEEQMTEAEALQVVQWFWPDKNVQVSRNKNS